MRPITIVGTLAAVVTLFVAPSFVLAGGTASIAGLVPSDTIGVGTPVTFTVLSSGFTNSTYKVVDSFPGGVTTVNINANGVFTWTPNNSDVGSHGVTVTVSDSLGNTANASQTINVVAPGISIGSLSPGNTLRYGNSLTFSLSATGFVSPQYSITDSYPYSTVTSANTDSNGNFHWTPQTQDMGTHILTATARDYFGHVSTATQQVVVTGVATASLLPISPSSLVHVGDAVSFSATTSGFTSPTFAVKDAFTSSLGTSTLAIGTNGKVTWTPNSNDVGSHTIVVTVKDSVGNINALTANITVLAGSGASNYAPVVTPYTAATSTPTTTSSTSLYIFTLPLMPGVTNKEVTALQQLLVKLGYLNVTPTGYFGSLTAAALKKFQTAHGIAPAGYVGPMTRVALNTGK